MPYQSLTRMFSSCTLSTQSDTPGADNVVPTPPSDTFMFHNTIGPDALSNADRML
jgi:hypothetical protein